MTRGTGSSSVTSAPPPYRSAASAFPRSARPLNAVDLLSRERNPGAITSRVVGPASITRDDKSRSFSSVNNGNSSLSAISAAEIKARERDLRSSEKRTKDSTLPRDQKGFFKAACATDVLFLMDTTSSMYNYIKAAKEQVASIVSDIKRAFHNEVDVRVAVVGYKDHGDHPNIEFLDFTSTTQQVTKFLGRLKATGGADAPEDVLGGISKALKLSWKQKTRCIIHIADAPPHGSGILHDFGAGSDDYPRPGSEPHGLTYKPLLNELIKLEVNYALLRINSSTNRMALAFAQFYAASGAGAKLLPFNIYASQVNGIQSGGHSGRSGASTKCKGLQFEELELDTNYSQLRHLVVASVTNSVSHGAGHRTYASNPSTYPVSHTAHPSPSPIDCPMPLALIVVPKPSCAGGKSKNVSTDFTVSGEDAGGSVREIQLEEGPPQWDMPGWLDETFVVEGFCPDMVLQSANSLNDMMSADDKIKLSFAQLTIHARSKPFAEGSVRLASYARTAASTGKFVVKSFKDDGKMLPYLAEDMRIQALCKAFALEFNGLLKIKPPIDFIATTCLQSRANVGSEGGCLSLEPYIDGEYTKYNNNQMYVKEDSPDEPDQFNQIAQAFSHFTFERSWGHFLVNDLQGVGHLLTDPAIQTRDPERFKLAATNFGEDGFKFFFVTHECNFFCRELELKSNREMMCSGHFQFRERWPTIEPTVCCSNKLCRQIVHLASAHESDHFPGYHWCDSCWSQLQSSMIRWICAAPGPTHEFDTSKFFYESQGQLPLRRCSEHVERDKSVSNVAVVGGKIWSRMKAEGSKEFIAGKAW